MAQQFIISYDSVSWLDGFLPGFTCAHSCGRLHLEDWVGWDIQAGLTRVWPSAGAPPFSSTWPLVFHWVKPVTYMVVSGPHSKKAKWKLQSLLRPRPGTAQHHFCLILLVEARVKLSRFHHGKGLYKGVNTKKHD